VGAVLEGELVQHWVHIPIETHKVVTKLTVGGRCVVKELRKIVRERHGVEAGHLAVGRRSKRSTTTTNQASDKVQKMGRS
jgi:hypothetical protein